MSSFFHFDGPAVANITAESNVAESNVAHTAQPLQENYHNSSHLVNESPASPQISSISYLARR